MVKLHLFTGFENERLGIKKDTRLGHLYSDESCEELLGAAKILGINPRCIQNSRGFYHFDLWGGVLEKARERFRRVSNREIYTDMKIMNRGK